MQMSVSMQGQFLTNGELEKLCLSETDQVAFSMFENEALDYVLVSHELSTADTLAAWRLQGQFYSCIKNFLRTNSLAQHEIIRNGVYGYLKNHYNDCFGQFIQCTHHSAFQPHYAEEFLDYLLMFHNYNFRSTLKHRRDIQRTDGTATPLFYSSQEIRNRLKQDEVAIQFCFNKRHSIMGCYIFVISPDYPFPLFLKMDSKVSIWLNLYVYNLDESRTTAEWIEGFSQYRGVGAYLHDQFPEVFSKAKTIYLVGNGIMNLIPYNISHVKKDEYMMERWNFHQLTSLNEIPDLKNRSVSYPRSAILFGDMQYYSKPVEYQAKMHTRGITTRSDKLQPLPYSKHEVDNIEQLLVRHKVTVKKFMRQEALEDRLCQLSGCSPQILHFSTHAFFMKEFSPPAGGKVIDYDEQEYLDEYGYGQGLFFSNSGPEWNKDVHEKGILPRKDNILTAYEISQLDLSNTDLVILSACDTGQGSPDESVEYMGLVRAFKIAGVKSVLMSLWEVDDEATSQLMILFYKEWLKGMDYHEAFRKAQMQMKKHYSNPYYWAGFVLMD